LTGATAGTIFAVACFLAPNASANPTPKIPASAQGHAYRHGVVPRRGHQLPTSPSGATPSVPPTIATSLAYGGGTSVSGVGRVGVTTGSPKVYLVFWGSQWGSQGEDTNGYVTLSGDPMGMAPYLQSFIKGLGTNGETWSGVTTQYCQGKGITTTCPPSNTQHVAYPIGGALAGVWVDESTSAPGQASAHQIAAEAVSAAGHFGNITTSANRNAQYVIVSPTGTNPDGFNTNNPNSDFCGWHDYTGDGALPQGPYGPIAFTNLPYIPDARSACGENFVNPGSSGALDGVSIIEGHEYAETITDQFPGGGWTVQDSSNPDNGFETADLCAWIQSGQGASADVNLATGSFAVQSTWANDFSNDGGGCEISHPLVTNNDITVENPGAQTSATNQPLGLQITSSDPSAEYTAAGLPAGLSISTAGVISGTPTTPGTSTVTVYAFDPAGTSGSTSFSWAVGPTTTTVSCDPSSLTGGTQTTCTATVSDTSGGSPTTPTGKVAFGAGGGNVSSGTCTLQSAGTSTASCSTAYTPTAAGSQSVIAAYPGDGVHQNSTGSASLTVAPRSSSTSIVCTPSGVGAGTATTCTATVSDASSGASTTPTGTVSFSGGGTCTLSPTGTTRTASCQTTYTPTAAGPQTVDAAYPGDGLYSGSSSTIVLSVSPPQTTSSGTGSDSTLTTDTHAPPPAPPKATGPACPGATGGLSGSTLGLAKLGMTRSQVRSAYRGSSLRSLRYQDTFCLTPTGLTVGYPSQALMRALTASQRKQLGGRAIWATTANRRYSVGSVRAGVKLAAANPALGSAKRVVIGRVTWYFLSQRAATVVIQVRSGVVREVGVASKQLTSTAKADSLLARSLS
jgi:serine protease